MCYPILHITIIAIALGAITTAGDARSITDKGVCFSDAECPSTHFCYICLTKRTCLEPRFQYSCMPRKPIGATCDHGNEFCRPGSYCRQKAKWGVQEFCKPKLPLNASCYPDPDNICKGENNHCDPRTRKCTSFANGFANAWCETSKHCRQRKGYFCAGGRCERRRNAGVSCTDVKRPNACKGYCDWKVCRAIKDIGSECYEHWECDANYMTPGVKQKRKCFARRYKTGKCARLKDVLKSLGAKCNPENDMCDPLRKMICKWHKRSKDFRCQQVGTSIGSGPDTLCTPNSPFSVCKQDAHPLSEGFPLSCRVNRNLLRPYYDLDATNTYTIFTNCMPRFEYSRRGQLCDLVEHSVFMKPWSWEKVDGVALNEYCGGGICEYEERMGYCVKIQKNVGDDCSNKFMSKCGPGLKCVNRTCKRGEPTSSNAVTHLGHDKFCGKDRPPCAPGLVCFHDLGRRYCDIPKKVVNGGQPCYTRSLFKPVSSIILSSSQL